MIKFGFLILCVLCMNAQSVEDVVNRVLTYSGGQEKFNSTRVLEFDWQVIKDGKIVRNRHHIWDKYTGDYVLKYTSKEGKNVEVYFNTNTKTGDVYIDGKKEEKPEEILKKAYGSYINDTYWLIVPFKLKDEGVNLSVESEGDLDVINMSFGKVGLTPGDTYKLFVTKEGRINKWSFVLESGGRGEYKWENDVTVNNIFKFATEKNSDKFSIHTKNITLSNDYDLKAFKRN